MKIIRNKIFETNSSSTHVITIPKNVDKNSMGKHPSIHFNIGEFGWEYSEYDLKDYIWTAICCLRPNEIDDYKKMIIDIISPYFDEITFEEPDFGFWEDEDKNKHYYLNSGYIDHSSELEDFIRDIFENRDLFANAILDGYVRTGNDNDVGYDLDDLDDNPDYYHYYKGN